MRRSCRPTRRTGSSPPAELEGFPADRFRTYAIDSTPLEDLAVGAVPVFVAQGTADRNSAPESADAMVVELLRRDHARAIRYLVLEGLDHGFHDERGNAHAEEVLAEFVRWSTSTSRGRSVETRASATPAGAAPRIRFLRLPPPVLALAGALAIPRSRSKLSWLAVSVLGMALAGATLGLWRAVATGVADRELVAACGALVGASLALVPRVIAPRP